MSGRARPHALPSRCEHCETVLGGPYCHVCGQRSLNPMRSFSHTVEELFETFWHLDGRVFRTLRLLFVPGRVAQEYLQGHRAAFLPPLRLSLIASVLAFLAVSVGVPVDSQIFGHPELERPETLPDLRTGRDALLARLERERDQAAASGDRETLLAAEQSLDYARRRATQRESEMRIVCGLAPAPPAAEPSPAESGLRGMLRRLQKQEEKAARNQTRFVEGWLKALPVAVMMLLPIFALLLKWMYRRSGLHYLEHLAVALYGNAWAMLMLTGYCAASWTLHASGLSGAAADTLGDAIGLLIFAAIPVYFVLQQKRVYGQSWPIVLLKSAILACLYGGLFAAALLSAAVVQLMTL